MDRRAFISTLAGGLLTVPLAVQAQQAGKVVPKIGIINFNSPPKRVPAADVFWGPMARLGWVEGQNVTVERRDAAGDWNQVPRLALELSRLNVDVFVITSEAAAQYVQQATRTIPICAFAGDFQAAGLVKNLSKPDQNITGVQSVQIELTGKRLALLKEAVPGLARVACLLLSNVTRRRWHYCGMLRTRPGH